jgi:endoglucanase
VLNPSYFSPRGYADLARVDHDLRWRLLVSSSHAIVQRLIAHGGALPPNWASLGVSPGTAAAGTAGPPAGVSAPGTIRPIGNPANPSALARPDSSFDAVRVAIRYAASCNAGDRRLAAALWPMYRRNPGRDAYALDGAPASPYMHAASFVAAAAAARAAGDRAAATRLLNRAQTENDAHPSYYGAAWVALGRVMLTTAALGACTS